MPKIARNQGAGIMWLRARVEHKGAHCLIWPLSRREDGYGQVTFNRKVCKAHRVMCELVHGPAPTSKHHAAHTCGNGHLGCVNPRHLSWKTKAENEADRKIHGRPYNRKNNRQLAPDQVFEIRRLRGVEPQSTIAARFGLTEAHVGRIQRGYSWPNPHKRRSVYRKSA